MIPLYQKGTYVHITTTNGGKIYATLSHHHYPTCDVAIHWPSVSPVVIVIPAHRIKTIERVDPC